MYRLYWFPGSAAMAPHALPEEIGAPYELVRVRTEGEDDVADDDARVDPQRLVPALAEGGFVVTEAAAIVMHLCDRRPQAGLAPTVGSRERAHWRQWLLA